MRFSSGLKCSMLWVDPFAHERVERDETGTRRRVRVHHHRRLGLDRGGGDEREDARDIPHEPMAVDRALEERGPDTRLPDALAELVHEEVDDPVVRPVSEKARELDERVYACGDHDVQVDAVVDPLDARDVPAQPVN